MSYVYVYIQHCKVVIPYSGLMSQENIFVDGFDE